MKARGVGSSEATWITYTEMVIEGTASPELRERVFNTFRYISNVKHRALVAAQRLVLEDIILPSCLDDYDVLQPSDDQDKWAVGLLKFPNLKNSTRLPSDTMGGVFSEHCIWLACTLQTHSKRMKYFTIDDCEKVVEWAFALGETGNWASWANEPSFEGLAPE